MAEKETKIGRRNTIEELGKLGESVKNQMDWLNKQVYGMTFEDLIRYMGRRTDDDTELGHPSYHPAGYGAAPAVAKGPCP